MAVTLKHSVITPLPPCPEDVARQTNGRLSIEQSYMKDDDRPLQLSLTSQCLST